MPDTEQQRPEPFDRRHRFIDAHATPTPGASRRPWRKTNPDDPTTSARDDAPRPWSERNQGSRLLHRFGDATSRPGLGLVVAVAITAWVLIGAETEFPKWWQLVLYSASSVVTLSMMFVIQHTQTHQQKATQRKLDEILRALPTADDRLISAEHAPDAELDALTALNLSDRMRVAQK